MIVVGIDCGAKYVKALVLEDDKIKAKISVLSGFDQKASAQEALDKALEQAGLKKDDLAHITATGTGKEEATFAKSTITEVGADAKAVNFLYPSVRTVIDVGAEEGRAIKVNEAGKVIDFAINDKCAAGAGTFTETMARALEVKLEEMGALSLKSQKSVPMNAQCVVFAESEVVSLIHAKHAKEDILRAVHDAIADRIASMARRIGVEKDVALVGGLARNIGFVDSLKRDLKQELLIPEDPEYSCALGAAFAAAEKVKGG
ncbi:MAG: acyl-CoA dehydratase activase [Candidatus Aminicenantes bacterium]|jgi:benzoyl-CoA reductase subunit D